LRIPALGQEIGRSELLKRIMPGINPSKGLGVIHGNGRSKAYETEGNGTVEALKG